MNTSKQESKEANEMTRFNITYESKNYKIPLMITVLAYSVETAAQGFHTFAGMLKIVKIEAAK